MSETGVARSAESLGSSEFSVQGSELAEKAERGGFRHTPHFTGCEMGTDAEEREDSRANSS